MKYLIKFLAKEMLEHLQKGIAITLSVTKEIVTGQKILKLYCVDYKAALDKPKMLMLAGKEMHSLYNPIGQ